MHLQTECKNYIRILHKMEDNRMYVCGTNAFDPECSFMVRIQKHTSHCTQAALISASNQSGIYQCVCFCSPTQMDS